MTKNSILYSPATIGYVNLTNRVAVAPMTRTSASADGLATDDMARYYARFARGGHSLVITEGAYTEQMGFYRGSGPYRMPKELSLDEIAQLK